MQPPRDSRDMGFDGRGTLTLESIVPGMRLIVILPPDPYVGGLNIGTVVEVVAIQVPIAVVTVMYDTTSSMFSYVNKRAVLDLTHVWNRVAVCDPSVYEALVPKGDDK